MQWKTSNTATANTTSTWDGKANTWSMVNPTAGLMNDHPAARACFQKNRDYNGITTDTDPNYVWYLPAQDQLLAIWCAHPSFDAAYRFTLSVSGYWVSTGGPAATAAWMVDFREGRSRNVTKLSAAYVRCVMEL